MTLNLKPEFLYGHRIVAGENDAVDFGEGAGELQATITPDDYTFTELAIALETALNAVGALTYSVTANRMTREYTIAASGNFELLITTGSRAGTTAFTTLGFNGADLTGLASYASDTATGAVYTPQFVPQDRMLSGDNKASAEASVQRSSANVIEVIQYGEERFVQMNLKYITNQPQNSCSVIDENLTGFEDTVALMDYLILKARVEYTPDPTDPSTFEKLLLERTKASRTGTGYELLRLYSEQAPLYFETGDMSFRKVD